jgi:beta-glucanase (GH16 family)
VEETMARIQEAYDDQKGVEQAMVDGSTYLTENDGTHYDDDLLLKELEELEQQDQEQQERKESPSQEISQRLETSWPSVPSASLQSAPNTSNFTKHVVEQPSSSKEALVPTYHASNNESHPDQSPKIAEIL